MCCLQQVENGLDRIEGFIRHLDKYRVPPRHGPVPQTGSLQSEQVTAGVIFGRDNGCLRIDEIIESIWIPLTVAQGAGDIDRIEMGRC